MKFATTLIITALFFSAACVSVSLSKPKHKRAEGVQYSEPGSPFSKQSRDDVDAAWKNGNNGNLMSYLTDCSDESDPSLENVLNGTLEGLSDLRIDSKTSPMVQGREGRRVVAAGKVDGVPTKIDLLLFKRDSCIYILTYVGVEKNFEVDHDKFNKFASGFRAP